LFFSKINLAFYFKNLSRFQNIHLISLPFALLVVLKQTYYIKMLSFSLKIKNSAKFSRFSSKKKKQI